MSISFVLNLFLLQTGCGMVALCIFLPKDRIDRHFFKSIGFFSLLFVASGLLMRKLYPFTLPEPFGFNETSPLYPFVNGVYILVAVGAALTWLIARYSEKLSFTGILNATSLLALPAVILDSLMFVPVTGPHGVLLWLVPLQFMTAGLVLGGFLIGMIFGHWYLINTDMPKRLLVRMALILSATLVLKILAVGITWLVLDHISTAEKDMVDLLISFQGYGIFFWQRVLVGLLIPTIIAYMIWSTARIGSNQSATGIMYVGVAFIFIGEIIAKFLFLFSTIPL